MGFTIQEIKERDAALIVMRDEPPSEDFFRNWEEWFVRQAGDRCEESVRKLFKYARLGVGLQQDNRKAARAELAEMLESLARQIRD